LLWSLRLSPAVILRGGTRQATSFRPVAKVFVVDSLWALRGSARAVFGGLFVFGKVRAVSRLGQRGARPRSGSQPCFAARLRLFTPETNLQV